MADLNLPEGAQALLNFRSELLKVLADIQVQLAALEAACRETKPLDESRMRKLKAEAQKQRERFHERLAELLPLPHEVRE
jgi:hypothetical protein